MTHFHLIPVFVADCPHETVAALRSCPGIAYVEPDFPVRALVLPNLGRHRRMKTHAFYKHGLTGRGANVAVLDTGITDSHPTSTSPAASTSSTAARGRIKRTRHGRRFDHR